MLLSSEVGKLLNLSFFVYKKLKFKSFPTSLLSNITFHCVKALHKYTWFPVPGPID